MSFDTLKKAELLKVADEFGVDVPGNAKNADIIKALEEDGVTWDAAKKFVAEVAEKDAELVEERQVSDDEPKTVDGPTALIKMERENGTYELRGYKFTKSHPFVIVAEADAEWITDNVEGFRYAKPKEAADYYG